MMEPTGIPVPPGIRYQRFHCTACGKIERIVTAFDAPPGQWKSKCDECNGKIESAPPIGDRAVLVSQEVSV